MRRSLLLLALVPIACVGTETIGPQPTDSRAHDLESAGAVQTSFSVLSRNLYLGADIDGLFVPGADIGKVAAEAWQTIQYTNFPARARALAEEIDQLRPHLIGLQEMVTYTILSPTGSVLGQLDFLAVLQQNLAALGLDYALAIYTGNTSFTAPIGSVESPEFFVNYRDGDAILYRTDVEILPGSGRGANFVARAPLPLGIDILRSWMWIDAVVGNQTVRFVNTHLETQAFRSVQEAQTAELIAQLEGSRYPVVLVGDFNSAANPSAPAEKKTDSYGMLLDAGFVDLWKRVGNRDKGLTCCHASDLTNTAAAFDQRIDLVLMRSRNNGSGYAGGARVDVLGEESGDRFSVAPGYDLWPSDHAGVAAAIWMPAHFSND